MVRDIYRTVRKNLSPCGNLSMVNDTYRAMNEAANPVLLKFLNLNRKF
jgi:hypothetical protein